MPETFGQTEILSNTQALTSGRIYGVKFQSGSAGVIASMHVRVWSDGGTRKIKCAIYDTSLNKVADAETEEKTATALAWEWLQLNFAVQPSVAATTNYWLCWWFDSDLTFRRDTGVANQQLAQVIAYDGWPDMLNPAGYYAYEYSIYATYGEAPPPATKTLVQAALISIPPLVVLPTLSQIIKVTGG